MKLNDPNLLKNQCYIDGEWTGKPVAAVTNPATGDEIAKVPDLGADETRRAIEAADAAFRPWRGLLAKERAGLMRRWFDLIIEAKDDLALLMTSEQGKPIAEAQGEIMYGAAFVELYAEEAKRIYGEMIPTHRHDGRILVSKEPVGVVGAITPWNFPMAMITRKVAPAIAVGCTTVCKPAPDTPLSALALAELADRAGIPKGVLNIVTGALHIIGFLGIMISLVVVPSNIGVILATVGIYLLVTGVVALLGGIYALQRKKWGLALAGSIITILGFTILGIVATVLIALSKEEFE